MHPNMIIDVDRLFNVRYGMYRVPSTADSSCHIRSDLQSWLPHDMSSIVHACMRTDVLNIKADGILCEAQIADNSHEMRGTIKSATLV